MILKVILLEGNLLDNISEKKLEEVSREMSRKPNVKVRIILNNMGLIFPYMAKDKNLGMTLREMLEIRWVGRVW